MFICVFLNIYIYAYVCFFDYYYLSFVSLWFYTPDSFPLPAAQTQTYKQKPINITAVTHVDERMLGEWQANIYVSIYKEIHIYVCIICVH